MKNIEFVGFARETLQSDPDTILRTEGGTACMQESFRARGSCSAALHCTARPPALRTRLRNQDAWDPASYPYSAMHSVCISWTLRAEMYHQVTGA